MSCCPRHDVSPNFKYSTGTGNGVNKYIDNIDFDSYNCRRLSRSRPDDLSEPPQWSVIGDCGPAIDSKENLMYRHRLMQMYPTMSRTSVNHLRQYLDSGDFCKPKETKCSVILSQEEQLDKYRKQVINLEAQYQQARADGALVFRNPLREYDEPLMDPTRPPNQQPVTRGLQNSFNPNSNERIVYLGHHKLNECGVPVPVQENSGSLASMQENADFILLRNNISNNGNKKW